MARAGSGDNLKSLDLSADEVERFSRAFKDEHFKELFREYAEEISDPENRKRYEQEISMMELERGMDVKFVHPQPGHVLRTSLGGKQRCYVNICSNSLMGKPEARPSEGGQLWSLPYSLAPGREDLGKHDAGKHMIYDVVFHPDTLRMSANPKFKEMVDSTALEAIEKQFSVKLDKCNVKTLKVQYKGLPQAAVLRTPIPGVHQTQSKEPDDPLCFPYPYGDGKGSIGEEKPVGDPHQLVQQDPKLKAGDNASTEPHFTITHRSYVDLQDYRHSRDAVPSTVPKELLVAIDLPLLKSASDATLDISERLLSLKSQMPSYSLRVTLPYPVDESLGTAKFNKAKRQLVVTLPVMVQKCQAFLNMAPNETVENGTGKVDMNQLIQVLESKESCEGGAVKETIDLRQESAPNGQPFISETEDFLSPTGPSESKNKGGSCIELEGRVVDESGGLSAGHAICGSPARAVSGKPMEKLDNLALVETEPIAHGDRESPGDSEVKEQSSMPSFSQIWEPRFLTEDGCEEVPVQEASDLDKESSETKQPIAALFERCDHTSQEGTLEGVHKHGSHFEIGSSMVSERVEPTIRPTDSLSPARDVNRQTTTGQLETDTLLDNKCIMHKGKDVMRNSEFKGQSSELCFSMQSKEQVISSDKTVPLCPRFQCTQDNISITLIIHVPHINKEGFTGDASTSHYKIRFLSEKTQMLYSLVLLFNLGNELNPDAVTVSFSQHNAVIQLTKASENCGLWKKFSFGVDEGNLKEWLFVTEENVDQFLDGIGNPSPLHQAGPEIHPTIEVLEVTDKRSHFRIKDTVTNDCDLRSRKERSVDNGIKAAVRIRQANRIATNTSERQQTAENHEPNVSLTDETLGKQAHGSDRCLKLQPLELVLPAPLQEGAQEAEGNEDAVASKRAKPVEVVKERTLPFQQKATRETNELDEDDIPSETQNVETNIAGNSSGPPPVVQEIDPEDGSVHIITDHTTHCAFSFQNTLIFDLD
ncbi:protein kintoun [Ambystoma mexicanum]|uniref:protein kintoun n=1 Tax=Ambystoma mexicanum TaxID=8296 RepID=UPI0037E72F30